MENQAWSSLGGSINYIPHLPQENDTLPAPIHLRLSPWTSPCSLKLSWMRPFFCAPRIHLTVPPSIYLSVHPGLCSLTRVWFQAESTPCKTSRSQRLHGGSREGRGGARPGFIPGRVQCSGVRSGPGGPRARWRDGWVDPLTDDCVSPEAERHRSQQVERVRERERERDRRVELTISCLTHF